MTLNEALTAKIETLRDSYDNLLDAVSFEDVTRQLGDVATEIEGLHGEIEHLRDRGYVYASYLENKAATLGGRWAAVYEQINNAIAEELENAADEMGQLDRLWTRLQNALSDDDAPAAVKKPRSSLSAQINALAEKQQQNDIASKFGGLGGGKKTSGAAALGGALAGAAGAAKTDSKQSLANLTALTRAAAAKHDDDADERDIERLADQLENAIDRVSKVVSSAKRRIDGLYGQVPTNVAQTQSQLRAIKTYLDRADNATFDWLAGEDLFMAVEAEWRKTNKGKENPDGILYITNQRIVMEQDEKKGGFMGFGGKKESGLLWEAPIGAIEGVESEKKGMLGGIDLIHLRMGSGAPFAETTVEVKGGINAEDFANKLRRAAKGDIERERGVEHDPEEVAVLESAPTACSVCGAAFDQQITRGMTSITCSYCGSVVRLGLS